MNLNKECPTMARVARSKVFDIQRSGVYHCTQTCVRQLFLCGDEYAYRRAWIHKLLVLCSGSFAFDVLNYAILMNHLHLLLRNRPRIAQRWSTAEVVRRWRRLFPLKRDKEGRPIEPTEEEISEQLKDRKQVERWRKRLMDLSWFMKIVAERVAKRANREDGKRGHFWAGRFGCRKMEDQAAVLAAAIYIDLNAIRAGMCLTPEESLFTSAHERLAALGTHAMEVAELKCPVKKAEVYRVVVDQWKDSVRVTEIRGPASWLSPVRFDERMTEEELNRPNPPGERASETGYLNMSTAEYMELLDCTGRQMRSGKRGRIPPHLSPIFARLGLIELNWPDLMENFESGFPRSVGAARTLEQLAERCGQRWIRGVGRARMAFAGESPLVPETEFG